MTKSRPICWPRANVGAWVPSMSLVARLPRRMAVGNLGLLAALGGAASIGGGCSKPPCEETLTCPRATGGAAGSGTGAAGGVTGAAG